MKKLKVLTSILIIIFTGVMVVSCVQKNNDTKKKTPSVAIVNVSEKPQTGEIFLTNISTHTHLEYNRVHGLYMVMSKSNALAKNFAEIGFRTKRLGKINYDENMEPIQGYVPVFVSKAEYDSNLRVIEREKLLK